MSEFQRSQVEAAISRATYPEDPEPAADLRTKIKRLLDTDRGLGRDKRTNDPERSNYAFFSEEAAGSGVEVRYSRYEAFALHIAFQMLIYGCPQSLAVTILRRARPRLEPKHAMIMRWGPEEPTPEQHLFLISASRRSGDCITRVEHILSATQFEQFLKKERGVFIMQIEIARTAWLINRLLRTTDPKKRGRGNRS